MEIERIAQDTVENADIFWTSILAIIGLVSGLSGLIFGVVNLVLYWRSISTRISVKASAKLADANGNPNGVDVRIYNKSIFTVMIEKVCVIDNGKETSYELFDKNTQFKKSLRIESRQFGDLFVKMDESPSAKAQVTVKTACDHVIQTPVR